MAPRSRCRITRAFWCAAWPRPLTLTSMLRSGCIAAQCERAQTRHGRAEGAVFELAQHPRGSCVLRIRVHAAMEKKDINPRIGSPARLHLVAGTAARAAPDAGPRNRNY